MRWLVLAFAATLLTTACTPYKSPHVNHTSAEQPRSTHGGHAH